MVVLLSSFHAPRIRVNLRDFLFLAAEQRHVGSQEPDPRNLEKPQRGDISLLTELKKDLTFPYSTNISLLTELKLTPMHRAWNEHKLIVIA
jgi:hypothetical protein